MLRFRSRRARPALEFLETRLQLSSTLPANTIGTGQGDVVKPRGISSAAVTVGQENITPHRAATLFGIFVSPTDSGMLNPRIVAVEGSNGRKLPLRSGRPLHDGANHRVAAFVQVSRPGPLTVLVTGVGHTTGSYQVEVTLAGDVNGDGVVNLADLQAFAPTFESVRGEPLYNAAADFNQNRRINLFDAQALLQNLTPLTPDIPLSVHLSLKPGDQAPLPTSKNSGGQTYKQNVTIVGHATPGSLVITDSEGQNYSFIGKAYATDSAGFFAVPTQNKEGLNNNDILILDPFKHQVIHDFPIFWIPFAAPSSRFNS
jgi:Dockerin type I domain